MQSQPDFSAQEWMRVVEYVLSEATGERVVVDSGELLQDGIRACTFRCRLLDGPKRSPKTVIVKQVKSMEQAPYDPGQATVPALTFMNEWASLQFLSEYAREEAFGPYFYSIQLLEDEGETLGEAFSLSDE